VQEMLLKREAFEGVPLHFIGRLQRNKARQIVGKTALIHSVDSLPLAAEIDRCAKLCGVIQDVLLEINIGREDTKGGFLPELSALPFQELAMLSGIRLRGLMCIPPFGMPEREAANSFSEMRQLYVDITKKICDNIGEGNPDLGSQFNILSMGMSDDYALAVRHGSTLVRVGSAIFGPRAYKL